jgi:glycosyltransferase involved in cell wall biosynthesis
MSGNLRVALVHDAIVNLGGAERVLGVMHECYPDAPIYTSVYLPEHTHASLQNVDVRSSFLQKLVATERGTKLMFPLAYYAMQRLDVREYDLVLSSSTFCAKNVIRGRDAVHVCYCYAPFRPVWEFERYAANLEWSSVRRSAMRMAFRQFQRWDFRAAQRPDHLIAISRYAAKKIERSYKRAPSAVIYPPVDVDRYDCEANSEDYFLLVSRLLAYKRVDVIVQAFNKLGRHLKIVGAGSDLARLQAMAGPNIEFVGSVSEEALRDLYARCRCAISPGEEDFGLTVVEAHACGKPVIAFAAGGALETVIGVNPPNASADSSPPTGVFFCEQTPDAVIAAVRTLERTQFDPRQIRARARVFDKGTFQKQLLDFVAAACGQKRTMPAALVASQAV